MRLEAGASSIHRTLALLSETGNTVVPWNTNLFSVEETQFYSWAVWNPSAAPSDLLLPAPTAWKLGWSVPRRTQARLGAAEKLTSANIEG